MSTDRFVTDIVTQQRMRKVRTSNTPAEKLVRSMLHRLGYRFTLHRRDLVGKPDIVLPKYRTVVFVHGCFWHGHDHCRKGVTRPKHNAQAWEEKLQYNKAKDQRVYSELARLGWRVIVVWECETKWKEALSSRLDAKLRNVGK
jgi:DNA mismatch endonuclease (patch repair protein)